VTVFPAESARTVLSPNRRSRPTFLLIGCAEMEAIPLPPESRFARPIVCRNLGNVVPPCADPDGGVAALVDYAIRVLEVRDLVVCGHTSCSAIHALSNAQAFQGIPTLSSWLRHLRSALNGFDFDPGRTSQAEIGLQLAEANVIGQLHHLHSHPAVLACLAEDKIRLHGWLYDDATGAIRTYSPEHCCFTEGAVVHAATTAS